jgi:acetolactate synthase-1/2/3 large subunit
MRPMRAVLPDIPPAKTAPLRARPAAAPHVRRPRLCARAHAPALSQPPRHNRTVSYEDEEEDLRFSGLTGGQLVHEALVECGVQHVFGYSGGANLPILDQFHKSPITFVMNRSEQCCGHAAEGYARASGRVGVVLTT